MKVYIAYSRDYECSKTLGVFTDEATAWIEGNARREESEPQLPVGTIWQPITTTVPARREYDSRLHYRAYTFTSDQIFVMKWFGVEVYELETGIESDTSSQSDSN